MNKLASVYNQVLSNYQNCVSKENVYLSDTWAHAIGKKGQTYSLEEMIQMRCASSKVSALIADNKYTIDSTLVDLDNNIVAYLLAQGESDFGNPSKNVRINGKSYTSNFLSNVRTAAQIIQLIENSGLKNPKVMEIGSGVGILMYLLKSYFKGRLTMFSVEIPETLFVQEWYLRNCFPEVYCTYKGSQEKVEFVEGGFNFINAHVLEDQDISFDVVISIASLQDMATNTVNMYFEYIQKNISINGSFFFQNNFGLSDDSVKEPSEYPLDGKWIVKSASFAYQFETCSARDKARFVFNRTHTQVNDEIRRLILRLLWNGFVSGLIPNDNDIINELIQIQKIQSIDDAVLLIVQLFEKHEIHLDVTRISSLQYERYFTRDDYSCFFINNFNNHLSEVSYNEYVMKVVCKAQERMISSMLSVAEESHTPSIEATQDQIKVICYDLAKSIEKPLRSEYWTAILSGMLLPLGYGKEASNLISQCISYSDNEHWQIRFAYLLSKYGLLKETGEVLRKLSGYTNRDPFFLMKLARLEYVCGNAGEALLIIEKMTRKCELGLIESKVLAKTAINIKALDVVNKVFVSIEKMFTNSAAPAILDILSYAVTVLGKAEVSIFFRDVKSEIVKYIDTKDSKLIYEILMLKCEEKDVDFDFFQKLLAEFSKDYYKLGWIGRLLQDAGLNELADDFFLQSIKLRPEYFLHYNFIGDAYLVSARFSKASECYNNALNIRPYVRSLRAKHAYCALPDNYHEAKIFGRPSDLELIFQTRQDFYDDIAI